MRPLCIYHDPCMDGFTAAWVVNIAFNHDVDMYPTNYGRMPPDVTDRDVIIVDFSYKRDVLMQMATTAKSILVLDHHKTAEEELSNLSSISDPSCKIYINVHFDMSKSGAELAWQHFFPNNPQPVFISYIADRDLWTKALAKTDEVNAYLAIQDRTFKRWGELHKAFQNDFGSYIAIGENLLLQQKIHVKSIIKATKRRMIIGEYNVPVANTPHVYASEVGHVLCQHEKFAATYLDSSTLKRYFSLRSDDNGVNVADIAKIYGGGGHPHAAGFEVPLGWEGEDH